MEQQQVVSQVEKVVAELEASLTVCGMYDITNGSAPSLKVTKNLEQVLVALVTVQQNMQTIAQTAPQCGLKK